MFKERNFFSKQWLKHTDKAGYKEYKWLLKNYKDLEPGNTLINSKRLTDITKIKELAAAINQLNLLHSGNAGDIIYALATIKKMHEITGAAINLFFRLNQPSLIDEHHPHPLNGVMLNTKMVEMLMPLIQSQPYINSCDTYTDQQIDIDLDFFRAGLVPQDKGNIARWCGYITGISPDLWKPWISVKADTTYANNIIIARSGRYHNKLIDHSFLNKYDNIKFIGVADEFKEIQKIIPAIEWIPVTNFLQMAQFIAGCKVFIGNQSFPYSIAEAMKVPRILEISYEIINVVPEGENGHDFLFQDHFEWLVEDLYKK